MADVYEVGVSIGLENKVSGVLAVIAKDLLRTQGSITSITKAFEAWKPALLGAVGVIVGVEFTKGLAAIARHGEKLLDQQDKLQRAGLATLVWQADTRTMNPSVPQSPPLGSTNAV